MTSYPCRPAGSLRQAGIIFAAAALLALLLPEHGLRLLAALFVLPPVIWSGFELARRRSGLALEPDALALRLPLRLRPLRIPYVQVVGLEAWPTPSSLGLAYAVPRPPFEGEPDPRPPRVRVIATPPLADFQTARDDLNRRIDQYRPAEPPVPWLSGEDLRRRLKARRSRRLGLAAVAFLATPLLVIVVVRVVFALLRLIGGLLP